MATKVNYKVNVEVSFPGISFKVGDVIDLDRLMRVLATATTESGGKPKISIDTEYVEVDTPDGNLEDVLYQLTDDPNW